MKNKRISLIELTKLDGDAKLSESYVRYICHMDQHEGYRHHEILEIKKLISNLLVEDDKLLGMTDVEFYKKANVDRKTFSKLRSNPNQKPSRGIAVAFVVALEMNLEDSQNLLARAGLTLSTTQKFDMIVRYFIEHKIYDISEINMALFEFDQVLLGSK